MSKLKNELLANKESLVLSKRHEEWLEKNHNPSWSDEALEFAQSVLSGDAGGNRKRKTDFRASGISSCSRQLLYQASAAKGKEEINARLSNIFATGNFLHLKWQMIGLTEGWLKSAEIPFESEEYSFGGTLDGIIFDDSLFEFKSINSYGYSNVVKFGPKKDHIDQANAYMWLADLKAVSFVYENKDTGDWKEFRLSRDPKIISEIKEKLEYLEEMHKEDKKPKPLKKCIEKEGQTYRFCKFREICLKDYYV